MKLTRLCVSLKRSCVGIDIRAIISVRWCSILVSRVPSEDGAKNPLKGISMKFLVPAADAQSGVGAGSKNYGRPSMA